MIGSNQRFLVALASLLLAVLPVFPAAAQSSDDVAAGRQAYAKAKSAAERDKAALDLGALLLARGNHGTAQMLGDSASDAGDVMDLTGMADLIEAEGLFRSVATGGGEQAARGGAGLIAALLAQGAGRDQDARNEIQRLRQRGPEAETVLCMAMQSLLPGDEAERPTVADLLNGRMQPLASGAPYLPSLKVAKPEVLTHQPPKFPSHESPVGGVVVAAVIDPQGHVAAPIVLDPGPGHMAPPVVAAIRGWTFRPALLDGKPVSLCYTLTMNFGHP
jgi:hypothetical protein